MDDTGEGVHVAGVGTGLDDTHPQLPGASAALMRPQYLHRAPSPIVARLEQTAERSVNGRDAFAGWGVVDPVRAPSGDDSPQDAPHPDEPPCGARAPDPAPMSAADAPQPRDRRRTAWAMAHTALLTGAVGGRSGRRAGAGPTPYGMSPRAFGPPLRTPAGGVRSGRERTPDWLA